MIEYYKRMSNDRIERVDSYAKNCWIKITSPTDDEINQIIEKFELDKERVMDGLDIYENSKIDIEDDKHYIFLSVPTEKIVHEYTSSFLIIHGKNLFITISKNPLEIFDSILEGKRKVDSFSNISNLLRILFFISRSFEKQLRQITKETKSNRTDLSKLTNKDIVKLINDEDKLNDYIASFGGIIQSYNRILREKSMKFADKDQEVIKDLIEDLNETLTLCKSTLRTISNMRTYYSTKLSNDLNKSVTILTMFTIFLTIPMVLSSMYGMNIKLPFQEDTNAFSYIIFTTIGLWIVTISFLKYKKLI
jgi:magnesium transporter